MNLKPQYITDEQGNRQAVVLTLEEYSQLEAAVEKYRRVLAIVEQASGGNAAAAAAAGASS